MEMKFDVLGYVKDNYICRCREHQPDTFFLIPKEDMNELGNMILTKEIELARKQDEIDALKQKIEIIEQYLDTYEQFYNTDTK